MEFRILGRLEVVDNGQPVSLGAAKQRALLAILLLSRRTTVSIDRLVELLWGDDPPPTATKTIQVYVSRLRKALGDGILETRTPGYVLKIDPAAVDLDRFQMLAEDGRAALRSDQAERAAELLGAAIELWRGPPLEEFAYEPFAPTEIARLEKSRLAAIEDRIEAELQLGLGCELVAGLEQLVAEHPLRERLIGALMLALYRAGRQSEALAAYRSARERLVDQLGLEPGPELRELERRILVHDPTLAVHRRATLDRRRRGGPSRRAGVAAVAGVALVVALLVARLSLGSGEAHPKLATLGGSNGVVALDPDAGRPVAASRVADAVAAVSSGAGSVWMASPGAGAITRLDPQIGQSRRSDRCRRRARRHRRRRGCDLGGEQRRRRRGPCRSRHREPDPENRDPRIEPRRAGVRRKASVDHRPGAANPVRAGPDQRVDPASRVAELRPSAVTVGAGSVWVAGYDSGTVERIDPRSGAATGRVRVGDGPVALTVSRGSLWVANHLDATVVRVDPASLSVRARIAVASGPSALAAAPGGVWVAGQYAHTVSRIDPRLDRVVQTVPIGGSPTSLTTSADRVWVGVNASAGDHRGGQLVITSTSGFSQSIRPCTTRPQPPSSSAWPMTSWSRSNTPTAAAVCGSSPISRSRSPPPQRAAERTRSESDPASTTPTVDSSAPPTSAARSSACSAFAHPALSSSPVWPAPGRCAVHPASCDLSAGIVTDDPGEVTFHLTAPDPDFLFKLTEFGFSAPIPPGPPERVHGAAVPPGTGPYRIVSVTRDEIRFARNPFFHEWSHAAQPTGNPNAIAWRFADSTRAAVAAVKHGAADWFYGLLPRRQYRQLQLSDPSQLHSTPQFGVEFIPLNTHRAPFNDVRVRQALNYAIDRAKVTRMYGGSSFASPTCQPLIPGLPGYRRYCPYTLNPRPDGAWIAPDVVHARRLVDESGTRGAHIDVWGSPDEGFIPRGMPAYVASVLRSLGYRVQLHVVPFTSIREPQRKRFQLSVDGDWLADYPDPSSYVPQFFACSGGTSNGYFCDPRLDRRMASASRLEARRPKAAMSVWASIDHELTNRAPWVPTVTEREVDVVSSRLRNYEYNPVWGFLVDQSWIG